jgi:tetratricopeptide (TPR) repeat protein
VGGNGRLSAFDFTDLVGIFFWVLFLVPYVGWGFYTLRLRYRYHEELPLYTEAITVGVILVFYLVELYLLKWSLEEVPVFMMFAMLGLFVSGAALYGPLGVSLFSRLLVDLVMPAERSKTHEPRYSPAEALERQADYAGALSEYLVIARIFPRDATVLTRIGEMHMKLERPEEAVRWFERALVCIDSAEKSLNVTNRICTIYSRQLGSPHETLRLLAEYIEKYPDTPYAVSVRERLERLKENGQRPCESG